MRMFAKVILAVLTACSILSAPATAAASGTWSWPVTGPVLRAFDPPQSPYGSGHRGIDIGAPVGTPVVATTAGTVTFAGAIGGQLFVTVNHGGGLESTYSWVSALQVRKNDLVAQGQTIARSGVGHAGSPVPHLHLGVKLHDVYVDPLDYLGPASVVGLIRLAPLAPAP